MSLVDCYDFISHVCLWYCVVKAIRSWLVKRELNRVYCSVHISRR